MRRNIERAVMYATETRVKSRVQKDHRIETYNQWRDIYFSYKNGFNIYRNLKICNMKMS